MVTLLKKDSLYPSIRKSFHELYDNVMPDKTQKGQHE